MAVERRAKLIIALDDLVSGKIRSITDLYSGLKLAVAGLNETFGRGIEFIKDTVKAYAESEQALLRQNNALRNQGFYSEAYSKALQQQARDLSKVSTQSDETIMDTQTLLTTFGIAGTQLTKTTKAALDLSAGLGIDLRTATLLLGKAWAGETQTLARYGLKVDETKSTMEKFAQLQDMISSRMGGRAAADAESYTGKIHQLAEAWSNLKEKIGEDFARSSDSSVTSLTRLLDVIEKNYEAIKRFSTVTSSMESFKQVTMGIGAKVAVTMLGMAEKVGITTTQYSDLFKIMMKVRDAAENVGPAAHTPASKPQHDDQNDEALKKLEDELELEEFATAESGRKRLEDLTLTQQEKEQMETEGLARELAAQGLVEESKRLLSAQGRKNAAADAKTSAAQFVQTMSFISTLANSKSKEMAAIGKAAAASMVIRETAVAFMASYKWGASWGGPPAGALMAGLAAAAGAGQLATIAGTPLAEGGMLAHRPGGVPAIMAEAGHDEVAIPLDDDRTQERLRGVFGGGSSSAPQYTFQIGTLVADEGGLMDLARKIDEKLFALDRRHGRIS